MVGGHTETKVGGQIRELRKARGLTLQDLAGQVNRSVGYISQLDRGLSVVSVAPLGRIAQALGVTPAWFPAAEQFPPIPGALKVLHAKDRRRIRFTGSGVSEELLSPTLQGESLMAMTRTEPGGDDGGPIRRDVEESGLVLPGVLTLDIDRQAVALAAGDSFTIDKYLRHSFCNEGEEACEVLWVLTPARY